MSEIRKKLAELSGSESSMATGRLLQYKRDRDWLRNSQKIALPVLNVLDEKNITQKKLADLMEVSPRRVSTIVKGKENLALETIARLEKALGVELITVAIAKSGN